RALVAYALGAACGFAGLHGWWSWRLYQEFGNPVFPYFNQVFHSPDFPPMQLLCERFIPKDVESALLLPFRMAELRTWVYNELAAPDLRFAVLAILAGAVIARRFYVMIRKRATDAADAARAPQALAAFFLISIPL